MPGRCSICALPDITTVCSNCKITYYCDTKCQRNDWKQHKLICPTLRLQSLENPKICSSKAHNSATTEPATEAIIVENADETQVDHSLHISYHKLSELSETIQQLLSINFDNMVIPKSICNEIASFADVHFSFKLEYDGQNITEELLFPSELYKYAFCNDFGFTIFISIHSDEDTDGFDGALIDINDIFSVRFCLMDNELYFIVQIMNNEQSFYVKGYQIKSHYLLCLTILKLEEYKYVVMVRDLKETLQFNTGDEDDESDEENDEVNDYEEGVFEFQVNEHFSDVIQEDTMMQIGNTLSEDYFDGGIEFVTIKPDVHQSL